MTDVDDAFEVFAGWATDSSPLYAHLACHAADRDPVRALADCVPADRAVANLLFAAVHDRILRGVDHPLAAYYPNVRADPRAPDDVLADHFADFCRTYSDELRPTLETRRTQTNAVGRSAALYPAISHVARHTEGPLALLEVGPSAGLNLCWDRFRYEYAVDGDEGHDGIHQGDDVRVAGEDGSPVTVRAQLRGAGDPPLPATPPAVHSRRGIDRNPLDVTDADDVAWLRALTWPEHQRRRDLLDDAVAVAREAPPTLVAGDAVADLPRVLEEIPDDVPVVVYSTLVAYQFPDGVERAFREQLFDAMGRRPLHWIAGEAFYEDRTGIHLTWTRAADGSVRTDRLGGFEPHGRWVEWTA